MSESHTTLARSPRTVARKCRRSSGEPSEGGDDAARRRRLWIAAGIAVVLIVALVVGWRVLPESFSVENVAASLEPHGRRWYAVPIAVLAFTVLSYLLLSVLAMTVVAGWVFGPWLGAACALSGCLCSAAAGFWTGRWLGKETVERLGTRVRRVSRDIGENGVLAVFLVRKIPAPFTLVNIIAGASRIRFRDFMLGTLLGMGSLVILLAVFGDGLRQGLAGENLNGLAVAIATVLLVVVIVVNHVAKKRRVGR